MAKRRRRTRRPIITVQYEPADFAVVANFDGSCYPNPGGVAKFAWVLTGPDGKELKTGDGKADTIYPRTNNTAEFSGMLSAIHAAINYAKGQPILVQGDSQLAINALLCGWKMAKSRHLADLANQCRTAIKRHDGQIAFQWVPRARNSRADELASFRA